MRRSRVVLLVGVVLSVSTLEAQTPKPAPPAPARSQSVRALLQRAEVQSADGDRKGALATLRAALALAPNAEKVLASFAELSLADRAPLPAIRALEPLTRMHPTVASYQRRLGVALADTGDLPAATLSLRRAAELEPDDTTTLVALGRALNGRGLYSEAKPPLLRSLELDPDDVDALKALAESETGLGDVQSAESHAKRALAGSSAKEAAPETPKP